jgi:hypothetical protein
LRWIREGVTIPFLNNRPPLPFNQGVSLLDATPEQLTFAEAELARFVETRAWERTTCSKYVSKLFLVAKPGNNQWRFIVDLRHMNIIRPRYIRYAANTWADKLNRHLDSDDWQLDPSVFHEMDT